jgi:hypothetical protein
MEVDAMESLIAPFRNEEGTTLIIGILMLAFLTLIGISATTTASIDLQVAGNHRLNKIAFYAAEAARDYVAMNSDLYGPDNIMAGSGYNFPDNDTPSNTHDLTTIQSFRGDVGYIGFSQPPRGSGFEAGKYKAHRYLMSCLGFGPSNAQSNVEAGFYRIGF